MNRKISDKDKKDWENFLSENSSLPNKDNENIEKKINKAKTLDLHGYSLQEANEKINSMIYDSYSEGVNKLLIITGKGLHSQNERDPYVSKDLGILKHSVPEYIKNNTELMSMISQIQDASTEDGGSDAFYVFLKKKL